MSASFRDLKQYKPPRPIVDLWDGTTWSGTQRRAEWAYEMLWEQPNGQAGWSSSPNQLGVSTVLRLIHGCEIIAFGIGETVGEAIDHLRDGQGNTMTLAEAIARWGGALPSEKELEDLRETARVTGKWPAHEPGTHCYACGASLRRRRIRRPGVQS